VMRLSYINRQAYSAPTTNGNETIYLPSVQFPLPTKAKVISQKLDVDKNHDEIDC